MYANSDRENGVWSDAKVSCTVWVILRFWAVLNFLDLFGAVFIKFTAIVMLRSAGAYYVYVHVHSWCNIWVNFDLTYVDSQFPLSPSHTYSWIRERKQMKLIINQNWIKINLKSNLTCNTYISAVHDCLLFTVHIIDCCEEACSSSLFQDNLSVWNLLKKIMIIIVNDFKLNSVIEKKIFWSDIVRAASKN